MSAHIIACGNLDKKATRLLQVGYLYTMLVVTMSTLPGHLVQGCYKVVTVYAMLVVTMSMF